MNALDFSPEELAGFKAEYFQGFTEAQFNLAIAECKRRNLIPGQHIVFQLRSTKTYDADLKTSVFSKKLTRVTTIDAFRLVSQRTGEYAGMGKAKFYYLDSNNEPTIVSEIPLPDSQNAKLPRQPWACAVPIFRKGFQEPVEVVCRFDAYAVLDGNGNLTSMWKRRSPEQLAKCAEAASRRAAFGEELGSMYIVEEFEREDNLEVGTSPETKTEKPMAEAVPIPETVIVPEVNNTPAVPTNEPRPNASAKDTKSADLKKPAAKTLRERARSLIDAGLDKKLLGEYLLKKTGAKKSTDIPVEVGHEILNEIEEKLSTQGKEAANEFITERETVNA
jgi:phage recombination protein Bet